MCGANTASGLIPESDRSVISLHHAALQPTSRQDSCALPQVFLPLVPGVDTLLEPLQEQAEDAQRYMDSTNEALTHDVEDTIDSARQRYLAYQKKVWPYVTTETAESRSSWWPMGICNVVNRCPCMTLLSDF